MNNIPKINDKVPKINNKVIDKLINEINENMEKFPEKIKEKLSNIIKNSEKKEMFINALARKAIDHGNLYFDEKRKFDSDNIDHLSKLSHLISCALAETIGKHNEIETILMNDENNMFYDNMFYDIELECRDIMHNINEIKKDKKQSNHTFLKELYSQFNDIKNNKIPSGKENTLSTGFFKEINTLNDPSESNRNDGKNSIQTLVTTNFLSP